MVNTGDPGLFKNRIIAAPLAGVTEQVFRSVCRDFSADIVCSEMISADAVCFGSKKTIEMARFSEEERPIGIQIFGADPENMGYAAAYIEEHLQPDLIDINCGCPVPKVVKKNGGAALLKDRELYTRILKKVVNSITLPVTVKLRSGWKTGEWVDEEYAEIAQDSGICGVILHPRSRSMGFTGRAITERIGIIKKRLSIPVIGNGDITSPEEAERMFSETGCDSVMIGRAALGNPWIFRNTRNLLNREPQEEVSGRKRIAQAIAHIAEFRNRHGEARARGETKKLASWYIRGLPGASGLRKRIFAAESSTEIMDQLRRDLDSLPALE